MKKPDGRIKIENYDSNHPRSDWRHREITRVAEHRAGRQDLAMSTHYEEFFFYRKLTEQQETCPCWHEVDPKPTCPLCFGTGYLPPYCRLGFDTHTALHASSQVAALNMFVDTYREDKVPMWYLRKGAYNGRLESDWLSITGTDGADLDIWTSLSVEEEKFFTYEFMSDTDQTWRPIVELGAALTSSLKVRYRVTASRDDLDIEVPGFPCLNVRYRVAGFKNVMGTQPQWVSSADRGTTGILDLIDSGQFIASGEQLDHVQVGDFFHHISTGIRFRVVGIENQIVNNKLIEWTLQARKVSPKELVHQIV